MHNVFSVRAHKLWNGLSVEIQISTLTISRLELQQRLKLAFLVFLCPVMSSLYCLFFLSEALCKCVLKSAVQIKDIITIIIFIIIII